MGLTHNTLPSDSSDSEYDEGQCDECGGYEDSEIRLPCLCGNNPYEAGAYIQKQKGMKKLFKQQLQHQIQLNGVKKEMEKYKKELESCKITLKHRTDEIKRLKTSQEEDEKLKMCQMCNDAVFRRYIMSVYSCNRYWQLSVGYKLILIGAV